MLQYIIPIFASFFSSEIVSFFFIPVLCLAILATIPCIIRALVRCK